MPPFRVEKLSDEFGQYPLILTCSACHYERVTTPQTLGRLCGWDARLEDVAKRLRCSKCGKTEMHGAGGAGTKTATWVNNIVANARTRTSGPDHTASEAGKQSVAAERLDHRETRPIYSVNGTSVRPCPPACAPCIRLTSERRAFGWLCYAAGEEAVSCFLWPTFVRPP